MPIEERRRILAKLLSHPHEGIAFNKHHTGDGATIFKHACALGCEGIGLCPELSPTDRRWCVIPDRPLRFWGAPFTSWPS